MRARLAALLCEKGDLEAVRAGCDLVVLPEFSLTGSVDPSRKPGDAITIDHPAVETLVSATRRHKLAVVFGLSERSAQQVFITQPVAHNGELVGMQRKRHLGEDEIGYSVGSKPLVFALGEHSVGIVIGAEAGVDWTWDSTATPGPGVVLFCSAPGLDGRKTDDVSWREGFHWWEGCGLGDAIGHAKRLNVWVAVATQAGTTVDEDFPGIAALVSPAGTVVDRLPDWRPGTLLVEIERPAGTKELTT